MTEIRERELDGQTNEQLIDLLRRRSDNSDECAHRPAIKAALVEKNIGLVKSIARRFLHSGEEYEDLVQAGHIGLLNAVVNYDLSRQAQFSTYATHLISGEIRHYIRDKHSIIRIPQWVQSMNRKLKLAEEQIFQGTGRPPRVRELANMLDLTEEGVVELLRGRKSVTYVSIDEERRADDPAPGAIDISRLGATRKDIPAELRIRIATAIDYLNDVQKDVLKGLFYEGKTQTEVGEEIGISQRQVSRVKEKTLDELRRDSGGNMSSEDHKVGE